MKRQHALVLVALALGLGAVAALVRPHSAHSASPDPPQGITVVGTGTARTTPDRADFSFSVDSRGGTASAALAANAEKMRRVLAALRRAGIASGDIQTENVSVSPRQDSDGNPDGFEASNSVSVKARVIARVGSVVDAAVAAGATDVSGPSFSRSNADDLYRRALRDALAQARAKADTLASASGAQVGAATRIVEQHNEPYPMRAMFAQEQAAMATPVEPGTQEIQATVTVTFALG